MAQRRWLAGGSGKSISLTGGRVKRVVDHVWGQVISRSVNRECQRDQPGIPPNPTGRVAGVKLPVNETGDALYAFWITPDQTVPSRSAWKNVVRITL